MKPGRVTVPEQARRGVRPPGLRDRGVPRVCPGHKRPPPLSNASEERTRAGREQVIEARQQPDAEENLLERARGGDRDALERVVRGIRDDVYNLAIRMLWVP